MQEIQLEELNQKIRELSGTGIDPDVTRKLKDQITALNTQLFEMRKEGNEIQNRIKTSKVNKNFFVSTTKFTSEMLYSTHNYHFLLHK